MMYRLVSIYSLTGLYSAIHDLEDSMDSGSFPSYLDRQNPDEISRGALSRSDQSRSQGKKSTATESSAQQRSRSAGNPGGTVVGGSSTVVNTAVLWYTVICIAVRIIRLGCNM